ncbi:hypothetical protein SAXI111661_14675 [Saccharomonospora xinjiangensis]|nr:hypothetical protein [Saccharomonospora xinjiangensis]QBQ61770.1 hypothetical protein EYD13_17130 [Saccharomonospora xinjiangensis]
MAGSWFDALADEAANGVSATAAVGAVLGGAAGAAVAGASVAARMADAAGGGSWSFDKDEIDAVIKDWKALAEELKGDRDLFHAFGLTSVAPSEDEPTTQFVKTLYDGLRGLDESNRSMIKYVYEFIGKLEEARASIDQRDALAAETFPVKD